MKSTPTIFSALLLLSIAVPARAQLAADNHVVTVSVSPATLLQVSGAAVNLEITGANTVAGQDLMTATNSATLLLWGTNASAQKVTVLTDLTNPLFTLQVQAVGATQGTPTGQVPVTTAASDFLLNIGRSSGSCTLRYTASVLASQGTGTDAHTITFTIQTQ